MSESLKDLIHRIGEGNFPLAAFKEVDCQGIAFCGGEGDVLFDVSLIPAADEDMKPGDIRLDDHNADCIKLIVHCVNACVAEQQMITPVSKTPEQVAEDCGLYQGHADAIKEILRGGSNVYGEGTFTRLEHIIDKLYRRIEKLEKDKAVAKAVFAAVIDQQGEKIANLQGDVKDATST